MYIDDNNIDDNELYLKMLELRKEKNNNRSLNFKQLKD